MKVFFKVHQIDSFYWGEIVEGVVVGETTKHYIVQFTDYSYVNFDDHTQDKSYTNTKRVRKSRCTLASEVAA